MKAMESHIIKGLDLGLRVVDMVLRVAIFTVHMTVVLFLGVLIFCSRMVRL